jgi:hypothetical protein
MITSNATPRDVLRSSPFTQRVAAGVGLVEGSVAGVWLSVVASLLVAALCYGLVRMLFGARPSLAAATTVAVAMALLFGIGLELLGYRCGKAIGFVFHFFVPASSLGIFAFVLAQSRGSLPVRLGRNR